MILSLITGQKFSNNLVPFGIVIHLITSVAIGAIFGIVISRFDKLRIAGFARGISYGIATGLIAFVIIFLPIAIILMPPKMMDLMKTMDSSKAMPRNNSTMNGQMAMPNMQKIHTNYRGVSHRTSSLRSCIRRSSNNSSKKDKTGIRLRQG